MKASLRGLLVSLAGSVTLLFASSAFAEGEACYNDDDCPNPACGGDVCNWAKTAAKADGMKIFYCQPAGRDAKGQDGWCTDNTDCKCKATGATCQTNNHCTDTGTPAAGGSGAGGSGTAGTTSAAGTTSSAGTTSGAGTASGGSGSTPAPAADDGGCSVSVPGSTSGGALVALGVVGLGLTLARRRR
jgi:MYXO-CTERM domain-containing protein